MAKHATGIVGRRTAKTAVIAAAIGALSAAPAQGARFARCPHEHLSARDSTGQTLPIAGVRVHRISCARAAAAIRASTFEVTPGGPLFSTPTFSCTGPVGPPPPHSKPRYYRCTRGRAEFEFLVPGFS